MGNRCDDVFGHPTRRDVSASSLTRDLLSMSRKAEGIGVVRTVLGWAHSSSPSAPPAGSSVKNFRSTTMLLPTPLIATPQNNMTGEIHFRQAPFFPGVWVGLGGNTPARCSVRVAGVCKRGLRRDEASLVARGPELVAADHWSDAEVFWHQHLDGSGMTDGWSVIPFGCPC